MSHGQFYLDKSNAKLAGVCAGFADYTGMGTLWVRIAAVFLTFWVSFITIPLYIAVALLASSRPAELYNPEEEDRLLRRMERQRARRRASSSSSRLRSDLSGLDRRIAEMEAHYTSNGSSRLAAEIDSLR